MEDFPNNESTNQGEQNETNGAEYLSDMPSYEEHMEGVEKDPSIAEKYYEQAKEYKERWIKEDKEAIKKIEELTIDKVKVAVNSADPMRGWRRLDPSNEKDQERFDNYRENELKRARRRLEEEQDVKLNKVAQACKNTEYIKKIAEKLQKNEDFNEEELEYLGELPSSVNDDFTDDGNYMPIEDYEKVFHTGSCYFNYFYNELLDEDSKNWQATIAKARIRELERQGRLLVHEDDDIQKHLSVMEENRNNNPFVGETNVDSETGEERSFSLEDNYPRLENESEEEYVKRLRSIGLKTRLAEKRLEQEQ